MNEQRQALKVLLQGKMPGLGESTVCNYECNLHSFYVRLMKEPEDLIPYLSSEQNIEDVITKAEELLPNQNTRRNFFCALWKLTGYARYKDEFCLLRATITEDYKKGAMSEERMITMKNMDQLTAKHQEYLDQFNRWIKRGFPVSKALIKAATDALISGLITGVYPELPPRRLQDYFELLLHEEDPTKNYFVEGRTKMRMNLFKNARSRSGIDLPVPEPLRPVVEWLAEIRPKRMWLLMTARGDQFYSAQLSGYAKRILGCSCNILRIGYVTEKYKDVPRDIVEIAEKMDHSVSTAMACYNKKLPTTQHSSDSSDSDVK